MSHRAWLLALLALSYCGGAHASSCEALSQVVLESGKVSEAGLVPEGKWMPPQRIDLAKLPHFCRVAATLKPTAESNIRIEVWMPATGWNGRLEGIGNGGFAGGIPYDGLSRGVAQGFAVATTDMGTSPADSANGDALIGHPEKWTDWGWRATHAMTVAARLLVQAFYQRPPDRAYFAGCSTGGEQALMEAQRFPDDYDGIVAGAPANNRTHLHTEILWAWKSLGVGTPQAFPASKLPLVTAAVIKSCARSKADPSDNFLSYPESCHWNPDTMICRRGDAEDCLTAQQADQLSSAYAGPHDLVTGAAIYPGPPVGSESGWTGLMPASGRPAYDSIFRWVFGAQWNARDFDFHRDVATTDLRLASQVNAVSSDLSQFRAHGHKMIGFHGWADWLVPSMESILYYSEVERAVRSSSPQAHAAVEDFYRLFMIPGMAHCGGGSGLNEVETLSPLMLWVEKGVAPQSIEALRREGGNVTMRRPVCAYPSEARYRGAGDPGDAANFTCGAE